MRATSPKAYKGAGMEGWVARWYARTRRNDMEDFRRQAKSIAARLASGSDLLEVAPGPGFFAIELSRLGDFKITALDISRTLVAIAKENAREAGLRIDFRLGNASAMPFYKRGKSREKVPRRLEGAKIFAMLSSPCNVERLWGF